MKHLSNKNKSKTSSNEYLMIIMSNTLDEFFANKVTLNLFNFPPNFSLSTSFRKNTNNQTTTDTFVFSKFDYLISLITMTSICVIKQKERDRRKKRNKKRRTRKLAYLKIDIFFSSCFSFLMLMLFGIFHFFLSFSFLSF